MSISVAVGVGVTALRPSRPSLFIRLDTLELDTSLLVQPEIRIPGSRVTPGYVPASSGGEGALAWTIVASGDDWLLTFTDWDAARAELADGDPDHILVPQVAESTTIDLSDGDATFEATIVGTDATFTIVGGPYAGSYTVPLADLEDGPVNLVAPVPSSVEEAGDTLSIVPGLWVGAPSLVVTRQIIRGASTVVQTGFADYTITADDVTDGIKLRESAADANGSVEVDTSVAIGYQGDVSVIDVSGAYYRVTAFTESGAFVLPEAKTVEYLIVAGGGGGGSGDFAPGGGGGAGGVLTGSTALTAATYPIVVGLGGAGAPAISNTGGANGENSTAFGLTALGGGRGASRHSFGSEQPDTRAHDGGSGGGAATVANLLGGHGEAGPPRQGYDGADFVSGAVGGGGGGGAGGAGVAADANGNGHGGPGVASSITGTEVYYGGGGGGATAGSARFVGVGGVGGGGSGSNLTKSTLATPGAANTGGGGGAGGYWNNPSFDAAYAGQPGGSGVVIVRYEITEAEYLASL